MKAGARSRRQTVAKLSQNPIDLTRFGFAFERKQIPRFDKTSGKRRTRRSGWSRIDFAQGRCATRLRYAPTLKILKFTAVSRSSAGNRLRGLHPLTTGDHPAPDAGQLAVLMPKTITGTSPTWRRPGTTWRSSGSSVRRSSRRAPSSSTISSSPTTRRAILLRCSSRHSISCPRRHLRRWCSLGEH
jgi:hypothetical protein